MEGYVPQHQYDQLLELLGELRAEVKLLREENRQLKARIAELEKKNPTARVEQPYSLQAEERRRKRAGRSTDKAGKSPKSKSDPAKRPGRRTTDEKSDLADSREIVHPEQFKLSQCYFIRDRVVWRIVDGRAIRVVYEIWHGPGGEKAQPSGVFARSEFGIEIQVTVAYLVNVVGLSIDHSCQLLGYFWQLEISKSQANALLNQLSSRWEGEFETLCDLLSISAVVHADETSWSIRSVWAFLSEQARVMVFGCHKNAATLSQLLCKEKFQGLLVSDNAAVYQGFSTAQKCWAHLLRKAIKLTLVYPANTEYQAFLNHLLELYYEAREQAGKDHAKATEQEQVIVQLSDRLSTLLAKYTSEDTLSPLASFDKDFQNLVLELIGLMFADELFAFVSHNPSAGTNNEAERSLRMAAKDRRTSRTSKTARGARRRSILASVFESLRLHLATMSLQSIVAEVVSWQDTGQSLFDRLRQKAGLDPPGTSRLEKLVPNPSPV